MGAERDFLVRVRVELPAEMGNEDRSDLLAREYRQARELLRRGVLVSIWRIPGALENVGIWRCADEAALCAELDGLPVAPWRTVEITPLDPHPVNDEAAGDHG